MNIREVAALIERLENSQDARRRETTYRPELERVIARLMDAIFVEKDQQRKMALVALEYRARLIRERWNRQPQN